MKVLNLKFYSIFKKNINLKILDVGRNSKIQKAQITKLLSHLNNESSKALYSYVNINIFGDFFKMIKFEKNKSDFNNDPIMVSVISKIELLKLLASDFNNLENYGVIRLNTRITNL